MKITGLTDTHRNILFYTVCIPVRLAFAYIQNSKYAMPWLNIFIGLSFIYQWFTWKGQPGFFGGKLWWNKMRLVHGIMYILAYYEPRLLYIDVLFGFIAKTCNMLK
jgi:hypothetical protein